jgi:hypothetical protein
MPRVTFPRLICWILGYFSFLFFFSDGEFLACSHERIAARQEEGLRPSSNLKFAKDQKAQKTTELNMSPCFITYFAPWLLSEPSSLFPQSIMYSRQQEEGPLASPYMNRSDRYLFRAYPAFFFHGLEWFIPGMV